MHVLKVQRRSFPQQGFHPTYSAQACVDAFFGREIDGGSFLDQRGQGSTPLLSHPSIQLVYIAVPQGFGVQYKRFQFRTQYFPKGQRGPVGLKGSPQVFAPGRGGVQPCIPSRSACIVGHWDAEIKPCGRFQFPICCGCLGCGIPLRQTQPVAERLFWKRFFQPNLGTRLHGGFPPRFSRQD